MKQEVSYGSVGAVLRGTELERLLVGLDLDDGVSDQQWRIVDLVPGGFRACAEGRFATLAYAMLRDAYLIRTERISNDGWAQLEALESEFQLREGLDRETRARLSRFGIPAEAIGHAEARRRLSTIAAAVTGGRLPASAEVQYVFDETQSTGSLSGGASLMRAILHLAEVAADPRRLRYRFMLAVLLRRAGHPAQALEVTSFMEDRGGDSSLGDDDLRAAAWTNRGACYADLGKFQAAERCAAHAWRLRPGNQHTSRLYQRIYHAKR